MSLINRIVGFLQNGKDESYKYRKESYSQCGEDLIIDFLFSNLGINTPSYIDIGAHHPFSLSNTFLLHKKGSKGINIEANPQLFKKIKDERIHDINLNIGIGPQQGRLKFYIMSNPVLSTFSKEDVELSVNAGFSVESVQEIEVETISNIVNRYCNGIFPLLLSIDVEGYDEEILKSIEYNISSPFVICAETLTFSEFGHGEKKDLIISFLKNKGYFVYSETYINTIFVKEDKWNELTRKNK